MQIKPVFRWEISDRNWKDSYLFNKFQNIEQYADIRETAQFTLWCSAHTKHGISLASLPKKAMSPSFERQLCVIPVPSWYST